MHKASFQARGLDFTYSPRLKITELFHSLQGEGVHAGLACSFVRLTGCALRCTYCDSEYAFYGGQQMGFDEIHQFLSQQPSRLVQITGGEPLHQKAVWPFVDQLLERGFKPLIETSGAVSIEGLHPDAHIVLDIKTPESGESERMVWENLDLLKHTDELKFVFCSEADLAWSLQLIKEKQLDQRAQVLLSPIWSLADKGRYADQVANSGLLVRFQVQLHKVLWGDVAGK